MPNKINLSSITAHRSYSFERTNQCTHNVYQVQLDGAIVGHFRANDLPQARGLARKALQEAFDSRWNQTLIFRGELAEDDVSVVRLHGALTRVFAASARFEG